MKEAVAFELEAGRPPDVMIDVPRLEDISEAMVVIAHVNSYPRRQPQREF